MLVAEEPPISEELGLPERELLISEEEEHTLPESRELDMPLT